MYKNLNPAYALLLAIVLVASSGCVSRSPDNGPITIDIGSYVGLDDGLYGTVVFRNEGHDLENFTIYLIDDGILNGDCYLQRDLLRKNEIALAHCSFYPEGMRGETDILIGFSFNSNLSLVIPDIEFASEQEVSRGVDKVQKSYSASDEFAALEARFVQPMPFQSGDNVSLVFTVRNLGDGILNVDYLEIQDLHGIVKTCYNMEREGNSFVPDKRVVVRNGLSNEMTCILNHNTTEYLNIKSMEIKLGYSYMFTRSSKVVVG